MSDKDNRGRLAPFILAVCVLFLAVQPGEASYFRQKESDIDPNVFRIKEQDFMGVRVGRDVALIDQDGAARTLKDFEGKPTILVWSYYTCDGSCSAVNIELKTLLESVKNQTLGEDYQVLTLSFDKNDTLESLKAFRTYLDLPPEWEKNWTFALLQKPEQIDRLTARVGFKYFWAPQDKTFYHTNVFILLTPDGRVSRFLYALTNTDKDVGLAILEARQGDFKLNEVIDFAIGLCYSYNYEEGRYTYNIPLFVGLGALFIGLSMLLGSVLLFRKKKFNKEGT
ncbi:MAG: SCO family protein [Magnetococcales bacterium]|nr:SCO family protein [Magnetococcales bacterium]